MGGGGSSGYFPSNPERLHRLLEEAKQQAERDRRDNEINDYLQELLVGFNERDADKIRDRLDQLEAALGDVVEVDRFLFGGSVAKHTYVDGLSDVDALVILNREQHAEDTPKTLLKAFHAQLQDSLTFDEVSDIRVGRLAVTVVYRDKTEIQLLPALRSRKKVEISDSDGGGWIETNPLVFQKALSDANRRLGNSLVPAIKLAKVINSSLPEQKQLSGYHVESLAVRVFEDYDGRRTPTAMLRHFFDAASKSVLDPVPDVTLQSVHVDASLGVARSAKRRLFSDALASIARKLEAAAGVAGWKELFNE
jgi:hypothetical protein